MSEKQFTGLTVTFFVCLWIAAAFVDLGGLFESNPPSPQMVTATIVVLGVWPIAAWFAGRRSATGFVRAASIFWLAAIAGGPLLIWFSNNMDAAAKFDGILMLLALVLWAPLYGLSNVVSGVNAITQTAIASSVGFALTLAAYFVGRKSLGVFIRDESE